MSLFEDIVNCFHKDRRTINEQGEKRFRGSIYVDFSAVDEAAAKSFLHQLAGKVPNSHAGGVARMVKGDVLGNAKRVEAI